MNASPVAAPRAPAPAEVLPGVEAVVVSFNSAADLPECLDSVRAAGVGRVCVVENGDPGPTRSVVAGRDGVALVEPGANLGFGPGANFGVAGVAAPVVLLLNPDTVLQGDTAAQLLATLDSDPRIAVVAPRVLNPDGSVYPSARRFPSLSGAAGHALLGRVWRGNPFTHRYHNPASEIAAAADVDWVSGTCMLVRREAFREIGGFDPRYFMYLEDTDLCWRFHTHGWRVVYEPGAHIVHHQGTSTAATPYRMVVAHHVSALRFWRRTAPPGRRWLAPVAAAFLAVRAVLSAGLVLARRLRAGRGRPA
jgi:N-acetylglucosaminyl-diphospho-decaprenol L-rhamnosyltransferase